MNATGATFVPIDIIALNSEATSYHNTGKRL